MKVLLDSTSKVLSAGEADPGWAAPAGGRVVDTARTLDDFLAADTQAAQAAQASEVAWQAGAFAVRAATLSAEQAQRRQDATACRAYIVNPAPTTADVATTLKAALRLLADRLDRLG